MKVVAAGGLNVKTLGRAIHCLARIGNELFIESLDDGVAFRTVNSSRSAYACFLFAPSFFESYVNSSGDDAIKCRLSMKSCLPVFKSLSFLEKYVEKCKIVLDVISDRLVFQLNCKYGIVKTYNLAFTESETLQAVFSRDDYSNVIIGDSRVFSEAVQNFQTTQEEISLSVSPDRLVLQNYTEDEPDPAKVIFTEMILEPEEFDTYDIQRDTQVTFCFKELRAILFFAETNSRISAHFDQCGKPIVFSVSEESNTHKADFVFATLSDTGKNVDDNSQRADEIQSKKRCVANNSTKRTNQNSGGKKPGNIDTVSSSGQTASKNNSNISYASTSKESPRIRLGTLRKNDETSRNILESDASTELDQSAAGSNVPPNKKVRSLFMTLLHSPERQPSIVILASDSDDD